MVIAGVIIETVGGAAPRVAARLAGRAGISLRGGDGDRRLAAVWTAPSAEALEETTVDLLHSDEEVLGVFPTFVGEDQESTE